ncbi:MAG TPA: hypothetical protein VN928_04310 [Myxococcales bacterium]|nr:hypothetical protein [Myxococcales bacterium]
MTTLGKTVFVSLSIAVLIGGTLALRSKPEPLPRAQLTSAQVAELQPAAKPAEPPKATRAAVTADAGNAGEPEDPELEDGSGS